MNVNELYHTFKLLYNKNNENKDINIPKQNFVFIYNREAEIWLADFLRINKHNSEIFKVNEFLVTDYELELVSTKQDKVEYKLPQDYFDLSIGTLRSKISTPCSGIIFNRVYKNEELNTVLKNKYTKPSARWERGVARVGNNKLTIYQEGFSIASTIASYYKRPKKIDMAGYRKIDNTASQDINPTYSDYIVNEILNKVVTEFQREVGDQLAFQLAKEREQ